MFIPSSALRAQVVAIHDEDAPRNSGNAMATQTVAVQGSLVYLIYIVAVARVFSLFNIASPDKESGGGEGGERRFIQNERCDRDRGEGEEDTFDERAQRPVG